MASIDQMYDRYMSLYENTKLQVSGTGNYVITQNNVQLHNCRGCSPAAVIGTTGCDSMIINIRFDVTWYG